MPSSTGYVATSRLDPLGQRYQGDMFANAPLLYPLAEGGARAFSGPAVLLTPTCDFALKAGNDIRHLCAVEAFTPESLLRQQFAQGVVPQHVVALPPLESLLPHGGAMLLRCTSSLHADQLNTLHRVTTLNEAGLRALLVGHMRYYLRTIMDGAQIKLSPDDPRLLWNALDSAVELRNFAEKRDAVHRALIVAIMALAHHHGFQGPDLAFTLYRLRTIAERESASPGSCEAIRKLVEVEQELKGIYETARPNPTPLLSELNRLLADLETAGWILQERNPVQITEQRYRTLLQE